MYGNGQTLDQIISTTGYTYNYIHKVIRGYPEWAIKHKDKLNLKRLQKLKFYESVALKRGFFSFIDYSSNHVYLLDDDSEVFALTKDEFFEALVS